MRDNKVRKFAKEARQRLLMNNYDKPQKKAPSGRVFKICEEQRDLDLYNKIVEMAKNEDIITNPVGRLIDRALFASMNETEKLKYVFRLSNKYTSLLEKYRNTETLNNFQYASIIRD